MAGMAKVVTTVSVHKNYMLYNTPSVDSLFASPSRSLPRADRRLGSLRSDHVKYTVREPVRDSGRCVGLHAYYLGHWCVFRPPTAGVGCMKFTMNRP